MKKILLMLILLISTACSAANYTATAFAIKENGKEWSDWEACNISIFVSDDTNHVEIYSKEPQVIDYESLSKIEYKDYTIYTAYATDRQWQKIKLSFVIWNNGGKSLMIEYSDYTYTYQLK